MVLEMRRALEVLKSGDNKGYRKMYDAVCEEVYVRSLLIIQDEGRALDYMEGFFGELLGALDEADDAPDPEKWVWQKYYRRMRKQYHKLLEAEKAAPPFSGKVRTLAEIPGSLPLLHRIILLMSEKDDFTAEQIAEYFGLAEEKVKGEMEKLDKLLPVLAAKQPESVAGYLANWRTFLLGASKQLLSTGSDDWMDRVYAGAADIAGVVPAAKADEKQEDKFDYFVAEVEIPEEKPAESPQEPEPVGDADDEYDEDEEDEYDDEDEEDDDDSENRYDWDLEDDGRRMVLLGILIAVIIAAVVGICAWFFLGRDKDSGESAQTEQEESEDADASLIIKGELDGEDSSEEEPLAEEPAEEEESEEMPEEETEEAEPEPVLMKVKATSSRIRSEANTESDVVTSVASGEQVEVLSEDVSAEWVQVRCVEQNNEEGYMMSQYLEPVE